MAIWAIVNMDGTRKRFLNGELMPVSKNQRELFALADNLNLLSYDIVKVRE